MHVNFILHISIHLISIYMYIPISSRMNKQKKGLAAMCIP